MFLSAKKWCNILQSAFKVVKASFVKKRQKILSTDLGTLICRNNCRRKFRTLCENRKGPAFFATNFTVKLSAPF